MKNGKTYTLDDQTRSSDKSGYREWMGRDSVHGVGVGRYIAPDSSTGVHDEVVVSGNKRSVKKDSL